MPFDDGATPPSDTSEFRFDPAAAGPARGIRVASADRPSVFRMAADDARQGQAGSQPQRSDVSGLAVGDGGMGIVKKWEDPPADSVKDEMFNTYDDPGGHSTIAYGHKVTDSEKRAGTYAKGIDKAAAERLLTRDVAKAEAAVRRLVKVPLTQNEYDAMVSYTFNIGEGNLEKSQLLEKLNAGDYDGVGNFFTESFITSSGEKLQGLINRRADEQKLFRKR